MKYPINEVKEFVSPFYADKDIMHDLSHIERIRVKLEELSEEVSIAFDINLAEFALYFHGIVYSHEPLIRSFMKGLNFEEERVALVVKIAWESQKESKPSTNEGLLLHDAHMLEGGRNFEIIKSLITGSVRGQSLEETMVYIEQNLLSKGHCYTAVGIKKYERMKSRTKELYEELSFELRRDVTGKL